MADQASDDPDGDATIAELIAGGMTPGEVAKALGLSMERVKAVPFEVTTSHVARVESAMVERAIGTTVYSDRLSRDGDVVRLETALPADVPAAKLVLEAYKPERYVNAQAATVRPYVINIAPVLSTDDWLARVDARRQAIEHAPLPPAIVAPQRAEIAPPAPSTPLDRGSAPDPLAVPPPSTGDPI